MKILSMSKFIIINIVIALFFNLTSCSFNPSTITDSRLNMLNQGVDEEMANSRLEQILECIDLKDTKKLKGLFSNNAFKDAENLDEDIEKLFEFVNGKIVSWDNSDGLTVKESKDSGKKSKEVHSYYYVSTDEEKYFFMLVDFPVDTINADNEGLYMLLVVKSEDESEIWDETKKIMYDGNKKLSHTGIYIPIE